MKSVITGIVSALITMYIGWISYEVYSQSKSLAAIEFKMEQLYPILQELSEGK